MEFLPLMILIGLSYIDLNSYSYDLSIDFMIIIA